MALLTHLEAQTPSHRNRLHLSSVEQPLLNHLQAFSLRTHNNRPRSQAFLEGQQERPLLPTRKTSSKLSQLEEASLAVLHSKNQLASSNLYLDSHNRPSSSQVVHFSAAPQPRNQTHFSVALVQLLLTPAHPPLALAIMALEPPLVPLLVPQVACLAALLPRSRKVASLVAAPLLEPALCSASPDKAS